MQRIVVGVDNSRHARAALQWAVDEARLRGAQLDVVHAWEVPNAYGVTGFVGTFAFDVAEIEAAAKSHLDEMVDEVDVSGLVMPINQVVVEGTPARSLLDAATDADLLVVGSRGRGGFAGLLLGSVSQHVVHHASCAVVIVRSSELVDDVPVATASSRAEELGS